MSTKNYTPKEFAQLVRRSVKTLQRWDRQGILKANRTSAGRRFYTHEQYLGFMGLAATPNKGKTVVYLRVSSQGQKPDLLAQRKALEQFVTANGWPVDLWLSDIGSGLHYTRKNFLNLLEWIEQGQISRLVIAYKDRLVRFGFEWFEIFCKNHGTELVVMNQQSLSPDQEMIEDLLSIVHGFSSRLYGLRKYKKLLRKELGILQKS
jgi:predicted site-specific integrase-resolvase